MLAIPADTNCAVATGMIIEEAMNVNEADLDALLTMSKKPRPRPDCVHKTLKKSEGNPDGFMYGETIVFTSKLEQMPRDKAQIIANEMGCNFEDTLTKATTILVVAPLHGKKINKSAKVQNAEKNKLDGANIRIMTEKDFYNLIELSKKYDI